ncbi:MAG TPA: hypothetical protein VJ875_04160 [Pyrinomonadaceae bacterium]|nr:hypothetical protein [Pyrinomonadaceae bacterium]
MSNRFERDSERADEGRSSASMMHLLGQMLMLPFTVFVYSMEMFVRAIRQVQTVADEGLNLTAGNGVPSSDDVQCAGKEFTNGADLIAQVTGEKDGGPSQHREMDIQAPASTGDHENRGNSKEITKETKMDRDLRDDMLKLVRYKVLFVKREYEQAFSEQEDLVSENMDAAAFTAWKVAEFIQGLKREDTRVPEKWLKYRGGKYVKEVNVGGVKSYVLIEFPDDDKKYLRVYYEVLDRYPRERFKYEERQIEVLEEIRDTL